MITTLGMKKTIIMTHMVQFRVEIVIGMNL